MDSYLHVATIANSAIMPTYELPFSLQSELGRAQAQLAESLANPPVSSPTGAEIETLILDRSGAPHPVLLMARLSRALNLREVAFAKFAPE
jgi:hypothetical protein